ARPLLSLPRAPARCARSARIQTSSVAQRQRDEPAGPCPCHSTSDARPRVSLVLEDTSRRTREDHGGTTCGSTVGPLNGDAVAEGNVHTNTVPLGSLPSMWIVPPCASTRRFTIDSPSPVPPYSRVDDEST